MLLTRTDQTSDIFMDSNNRFGPDRVRRQTDRREAACSPAAARRRDVRQRDSKGTSSFRFVDNRFPRCAATPDREELHRRRGRPLLARTYEGGDSHGYMPDGGAEAVAAFSDAGERGVERELLGQQPRTGRGMTVWPAVGRLLGERRRRPTPVSAIDRRDGVLRSVPASSMDGRVSCGPCRTVGQGCPECDARPAGRLLCLRCSFSSGARRRSGVRTACAPAGPKRSVSVTHCRKQPTSCTSTWARGMRQHRSRWASTATPVAGPARC